MQNGHIERFNGRFRDEGLNANWLLTLAGARAKIEAWGKEYNSGRLHSSLGYLSPDEFAARQMPSGDSTRLISGPRGFKRHPLAPPPHPRCPRGQHDEVRCRRLLKLSLVGEMGAGQAGKIRGDTLPSWASFRSHSSMNGGQPKMWTPRSRHPRTSLRASPSANLNEARFRATTKPKPCADRTRRTSLFRWPRRRLPDRDRMARDLPSKRTSISSRVTVPSKHDSSIPAGHSQSTLWRLNLPATTGR